MAIIKVEPILFSSMDGSLPLDMIERTPNGSIVMVSGANFDNHQHAKNEDVRLGGI